MQLEWIIGEGVFKVVFVKIWCGVDDWVFVIVVFDFFYEDFYFVVYQFGVEFLVVGGIVVLFDVDDGWQCFWIVWYVVNELVGLFIGSLVLVEEVIGVVFQVCVFGVVLVGVEYWVGVVVIICCFDEGEVGVLCLEFGLVDIVLLV